jgi:hypothetical protein
LFKGEFPEGWHPNGLNVHPLDENKKNSGEIETRTFLTTNESTNQNLLGFILMSSNINPKSGYVEKSKNDLTKICMLITRSDTNNETFLRMDNLMSYSLEKSIQNKYPKNKGHVEVPCEEICFKLSYVIGNVENNFKKKPDKSLVIHYGKLFLVEQDQYIVVLSPNLICKDTRKAFNWVFGAKFSKSKNKITLMEARRFENEFLLDLEKKKKTETKISKEEIIQIRKEIFELFVSGYANARLEFKKCSTLITVFTLKGMKNEKKELENIRNQNNWEDFLKQFKRWEEENKKKIEVWQNCVNLFKEYLHFLQIFAKPDEKLESSKPDEKIDVEKFKSSKPDEKKIEWKYSKQEKELLEIPTKNWDDFSKSFEAWKENQKKEDLKEWKTIGL